MNRDGDNYFEDLLLDVIEEKAKLVILNSRERGAITSYLNSLEKNDNNDKILALISAEESADSNDISIENLEKLQENES